MVYLAIYEGAASLYSLVVKQQSVAAKCPTFIVVLREELHVVKVSWKTVCAAIEAELFTSIFAHIHCVRATDSPHFLLVSPCKIGNSVSACLDLGFDVPM